MNKLLAVLAATLAFQFAWAAGAPLPSDVPTLTGEVLEVQDVGTYTYLRLKTADGEAWAAVNSAPVKKGAQVTIYDPAEMRDFESKALKRTFPTIYFGALGIATESEAASPSPHSGMSAAGMDLGQLHGGLPKAPDADVAKVAKADGADARTVAEINADRLALKDKPVAVRAKVVKVTAGVMGTNWVHLRDGSGSAADNSNDVLVTSKDEPKVGDVVVARGLVKTDVNFGSGYAYKVLVENASLEP